MNKIKPDKRKNSPLKLSGKNYMDMVHSSPEAIFVYVDEKIIFANNTALQMLRAEKPEDIIGKDVFTLVLPESRKALKKVIDLVIENRKNYISNEDKLIALDGSIIDIEISSTYFNFNGRDGIQAFIKDITKRKIAEEQLKKSEIEYMALFESTGTAMLFIDEDKTISLINGEVEKISGYSRHEIEGKKQWTEFIAPEDRIKLEKNHELRRKMADLPMNFEFRLIDKFGRYHNAFMTITLIPGTKRSVASIIDLTEIHKAEEMLVATQQNYRLLVENTKEAIAIIQDELVRYVNPKLCEITGYTEEQILNKKFYKLVHADFKEAVRNEYHHRLEGNEKYTIFPVKIIDTIRQERWFQINSVLTIWSEKPAVLLFFNDITETKNAQDALKSSEERYRLVAENAKDIIIIYDENGIINYMNSSGYDNFGLGKHVVKKINIKDILYRTSELRPPWQAIEEATKENKSFKNRVEVLNSAGEMLLLETISSPIKLDNDRPGMLVIARNITERKRLEKEIILISERIRQQVSRDLHDDLNPHLIGIEALTQVLSTSLKKLNLPEADEAEKIAALINKAITKTHRLARGLCPIDLESTGIQTPIINLLKLIRTIYGIDGKFSCDESIIIEDPNLATNLYYIAQEAVFNAAKYSGGTTVLVTLGKSGDHLVLSVEDNGTGIKKQKVADEDEEKTGGMGLKIMKYRTEIIDGNFQVLKNRPTGTIITVKIPIDILKDEGRIFYGGRYAQKQQEE
jgi:PAS domain S-box-containing protein